MVRNESPETLKLVIQVKRADIAASPNTRWIKRKL